MPTLLSTIAIAAPLITMIVGLTFCLLYSRNFPWYKSQMGRNLMTTAGGVSILAALAVFRRWDDLNYGIDHTALILTLTTFCWIVLLVAMSWRLRVLVAQVMFEKKNRQD